MRYFAGLALAATAGVLIMFSAQIAGAASVGLRVIGSGRSSGQFAVTAASGSKSKAHAIYLRGYGRGLSGMGVVACSRGFSIGSKSKQFSSMSSGRLYRLPLPMGGGDCDVTASLSGSGSIRLQILA